MDDVTLWERLEEILWRQDGDVTVYVYHLDVHDHPIKPYFLKTYADPTLPDMLRAEYNGGEFKVLIRRGKQMLFAGKISIGERPRDRAESPGSWSGRQLR